MELVEDVEEVSSINVQSFVDEQVMLIHMLVQESKFPKLVQQHLFTELSNVNINVYVYSLISHRIQQIS